LSGVWTTSLARKLDTCLTEVEPKEDSHVA
jgi:hypothetical protein